MNDTLEDSLDDFTVKKENLKVGPSPSKYTCFICFNESPLKNDEKYFSFRNNSSVHSQDI